MQRLVDFIYENIDVKLWKQYRYCLKNSPKKLPFEEGHKVTEDDLVKYYDKIINSKRLKSYDDIDFIAFEQYVLTNWENVRLIDMKFSGSHSNGTAYLMIEYGPKKIPRRSRGKVAKSKPGHEFDIIDSVDGEIKPVSAKEWVHTVIEFLKKNITE